MDALASIIFLGVTIYASYFLAKLTFKSNNLLFLLYSISAIALLIIALAPYAGGMFRPRTISLIEEWSRITAISFFLSGLTVLIRDSKPHFARFPLIFCFLPLLLIATYPFAIHTYVIKEYLMGWYEFGALGILILMHGVLVTKNKHHWWILGAGGTAGVAFIMFWLPLEAFNSHEWIYSLIFSASLGLFFHGYKQIESGLLIQQELE